jgi:hypothetical protein
VEVRSAAVLAFWNGRSEEPVLDLVRDSFLDNVGDAVSPVRTLVFGTGDPVVSVDVAYSPQVLKELTVSVQPPRYVELEVRAPQPELHHVASGQSPLSLTTGRQGPAALLIAEGPERTRCWRTSWVIL